MSINRRIAALSLGLLSLGSPTAYGNTLVIEFTPVFERSENISSNDVKFFWPQLRFNSQYNIHLIADDCDWHPQASGCSGKTLTTASGFCRLIGFKQATDVFVLSQGWASGAATFLSKDGEVGEIRYRRDDNIIRHVTCSRN